MLHRAPLAALLILLVAVLVTYIVVPAVQEITALGDVVSQRLGAVR